ncbi:MAG: lytic transglycosylase domain-containing protein [bacterium]|nr:lytic transglycosylase domain-containing protein [bacterium]
MVNRHANHAALEPRLVKAVIQVESAFDPRARSHKGAMGLMQLMPETAAAFAVSDPYDPEQNIGAGTKYLKRLIDSHGGLELGLAAYNAGPAAVKRFHGVPPYPETRDYVEKVMRLYKRDSQYSLAGSRYLRRGRKTYLIRDASGRLVMTTSPPSG